MSMANYSVRPHHMRETRRNLFRHMNKRPYYSCVVLDRRHCLPRLVTVLRTLRAFYRAQLPAYLPSATVGNLPAATSATA